MSLDLPVLAVRGAIASTRPDAVAIEEPLEIHAAGPAQEPQRVAITMRTPGHDTELSVGFMFTEGLIAHRGDLGAHPAREILPLEGRGDHVTVLLTHPFDTGRVHRSFVVTSACGVCGKASIEDLTVLAPPLGDGPVVPASVVLALPTRLRAAQSVFDVTGGLHATGLFTPSGELRVVREDVGRHNAMDKAIGRMLLDGAVPLTDSVAMVSGRASFELVQKATVAGVTVLCAVGAPSSLAVQAAETLGLTLVGFVRGDSFNVYTHPRRIALGA